MEEAKTKRTKDVWVTGVFSVLTTIILTVGSIYVASSAAPQAIVNVAPPQLGSAYRAESPAPTSFVTTTVTVTASGPHEPPTSAAAGAVYLSQHNDWVTQNEASWVTGRANIGQRPFDDSVVVTATKTEAWLDYTPETPFSKLTAQIGVNAKSPADTVVVFRVYSNGTLVTGPVEVGYGQVRELSAPITGGSKIRISATRIKGDVNTDAAVFGSAQLLP
ncbi:NPCBM/NEW2 domain-containing protein [Nonomuraea sp. NPDC050556]|uniref:NPCBM/NEW2 domain-containing protein n=1 Tax=Nonomuraea sp. NPDC050556 TaxID=3364369 RepID=UPI0037A68146